jgi:nucleotide-binding universal stress UspA family protein
MVMNTNQRAPVVAGIDGTDEAACAADYAAWEARRRGVEVQLVYAHPSAPLWGPGMPFLDEYTWERDWVRTLMEKSLHEVRDAHPGLVVHATVRAGGAAGVLVDASARAGMIVVGTQAGGGLIGHLTASVAAQVAAHAHCPVVVVRGVGGRRCDEASFVGRPVVVGVDGSEPARSAVAFAVEEAVARGVDLHAVMAWSAIEVHDIGEILGDRYDFSEEAAKADRLLDEALCGWRGDHPDLHIHRHAVHEMSPVRAILGEADGAGLVVVGSRGVGGFAGLLLGSTVDGLVRHSPTPVAVVHGEETQR